MRQHQWTQLAPTYHIKQEVKMNNKKELDSALSDPLKYLLEIAEFARTNQLEADESIMQAVEHIQEQLQSLNETVNKKIQEKKENQDKPSSIFFNCKRSQKARWVRKAKSMGTNLTQFLISAADKACEE